MNGSDFSQTIRVDTEIAYSEGLKSASTGDYKQLVEVVPTTSNSKNEVFYGSKNRLRRFRAERQPQKFAEYKMNMTSDGWEMTHVLKKDEINREQDPQKYIMKKARDFGAVVESSKEIEFWEFLRNGSSIKGFDAANLFDFNHRYVDASGVTNTLVAAQQNMHLGGSQIAAITIQLEREHYANLKDDTNKPLGLRLTHVAVVPGSENETRAMEVNNSQFTVETTKGQMTTNVFQGSYDILRTYYGIGSSEWFSFALNDSEFKPVKVLSETRNPGFDNFEFEAIGLDSTSEASFWRNDVALGVKGYFDYNPGYWFTARLHGSSSYTFTPADSESQRVLYPNV